jgi:hypothetical protein
MLEFNAGKLASTQPTGDILIPVGLVYLWWFSFFRRIIMSYKIITASEQVSLSLGQAVIMMAIDNGRGYVGLVRGDKIFGSVRAIVSEFIVDNVDSIECELNAIVVIAEKEGLTLLEEEPLVLMAKNKAVASIMATHPEKDWEYGYYQAHGEGNFGWQSFNQNKLSLLSENYCGICYSELSEILEEKYDSLMSFAGSVIKLQPKIWLLTTDYDGGYRNSWIVKGSYNEAKTSMIQAIKDIDNSLEINMQNYDKFMEEHVGSGDSVIYTASIEEV